MIFALMSDVTTIIMVSIIIIIIINIEIIIIELKMTIMKIIVNFMIESIEATDSRNSDFDFIDYSSSNR